MIVVSWQTNIHWQKHVVANIPTRSMSSVVSSPHQILSDNLLRHFCTPFMLDVAKTRLQVHGITRAPFAVMFLVMGKV
jgi:hypothetical protein